MGSTSLNWYYSFMNERIEQGTRIYHQSPEQFGNVTDGRGVGALIHLPLLELGDPVSESQLALFAGAGLTRRVWAWFHYVPTVLCVFSDASSQVDRLGESVARRYFQLQGINMDYPSFCYASPMIQQIARGFDLPQHNLAKLPMTEVSLRLKGESVERCLEYASEQLKQHGGDQPDEWIGSSNLYDRIKGRPYRIEISSSPEHLKRWKQMRQQQAVHRTIKKAWVQWMQGQSDQLSLDRSLLSSHPEFESLFETALSFPAVMGEVVRDQSVLALLAFDGEFFSRLALFLQRAVEAKPMVDATGARVIDHVLTQLSEFGLYPVTS